MKSLQKIIDDLVNKVPREKYRRVFYTCPHCGKTFDKVEEVK